MGRLTSARTRRRVALVPARRDPPVSALVAAALVLLALAPLALLAPGGCRSSRSAAQDGPKRTLEALHQAALAQDIDQVIERVAPALREPMRTMAGPTRQFIAKADAVAGLVEARIGKEQAALVRMVASDMKVKSPLNDALENGKVNWDKVKITVDGDRASVDVAGVPKVVELSLIGGQWCAVASDAEGMLPERLSEQARRGKQKIERMIQALDQLERRINDGTITKANFEREYDKLIGPQQAADAFPATGPETAPAR